MAIQDPEVIKPNYADGGYVRDRALLPPENGYAYTAEEVQRYGLPILKSLNKRNGHPEAIEAAEFKAVAHVGEDLIHAPNHYRSHPSGIEVIEITRHESFLRGNLIKYVLRAPYKGSELQDLQKARQYLDWEIERVEGLKP